MVVADAGYKTPAIAHQLLEDGIQPLFPYTRPKTKEGFFGKHEFAYDEYYDCYICPGAHILTYSTTNRNGYKEYKNTLTNEKKTETIPATGQHDYQVTDSVDATCTEKGSATYTCSVCGDSYTEETDMLEHSYEVVDQKDATCTEDGYTKYECSVCGDSYEETIKATGHDDGEWTTTKEASLFSNGLKELKCTVCGEVIDTQSIPQTCPLPLAGVTAIVVVVTVIIVGIIIVIRKKRK